jgi:hypothetical protein
MFPFLQQQWMKYTGHLMRIFLSFYPTPNFALAIVLGANWPTRVDLELRWPPPLSQFPISPLQLRNFVILSPTHKSGAIGLSDHEIRKKQIDFSSPLSRDIIMCGGRVCGLAWLSFYH